MNDYNILIVDDDPSIINSIKQHFKNMYPITGIASPAHALAALRQQHYHILLVDYRMPEMYGLEFLIEAKKIHSYTCGLLFTAYADKALLTEILTPNLVCNFVEKPLDFEQLAKTFKEAMAVCMLQQEQKQKQAATYMREPNGQLLPTCAPSYDRIIGIEKGLKKVYEQAKRIALFPLAVLITGETGTGKDLFAHAIHRLSPRQDGPYIPINCGALPESLVESELFGYVKGAFTGAAKDKPGKIELAHRGTLFLDEIAELKPNLQVKLLRALEQKKIERLGSNHSIPVDFRLIAASNNNFTELLNTNLFRADLFYRLNETSLHLPALRERLEDLEELVRYFIDKYSTQFGLNCPHISAGALNYLKHYTWRGNVRELANVIKQVIIYSNARECLDAADFGFLTDRSAIMAAPDKDVFQCLAHQIIFNQLNLKTIKYKALEAVLKYYDGHVATAVEETGIKRDQFYNAISVNQTA